MQSSPPSEILNTSENILTLLGQRQVYLRKLTSSKHLKKLTTLALTVMKFSKFFGDKIFEKVKLDRLKTIILKSITKDIEDLIRDGLLRNKYTLPEKSSDEIYKKEINMSREELKGKDFIIKDLLPAIKEMKTKFVSVQSNTSRMSSSEANLVPANDSVATEDVCNNNDQIADTDDEIIIPDKKNINDNLLKKSMQNQLEEVI